jgi:hypothetical protein
MSMTRKDIFAQLDAEKADRARIETEHAAKVAELTQALDAEKTRADKAVAEAVETARVSAEAVAAAQVHVETANAAVKVAQDALVAKTAEHVETTRLLEMAKQALANPAMIDAAMTAINGGKSLQATRDAEADQAEKSCEKSPESILDQWDKIADPGERRRFYVENESAIKAATKEQEV